jgi:ATP-dependent DNA helicase RecG
MDDGQLRPLVDALLQEPDETEWLEFKQSRCDPQQLGEYLSALANSACLNRKPKGYLVFGIDDRTHAPMGTAFKPDKAKKANQALRLWLSSGLRPNIGYDLHELEYRGKRIVLFEINAAIDRPVAFYGTAYVRIGSSKTRLSEHPEKEREIWSRRHRHDWSAEVCKDASIDDLDSEALAKARDEYKTKFPRKAAEVDNWSHIQFLNKIKLTIKGKVTNTALLLLGKPESAALLSPGVARISWTLRDERNNPKDYEHFGPPFLLNVDRVFAKVRNLTYRHLPSGTLFPMEISQYDHWVIREALHNCIAHQDYSLKGRINLVETPSAVTLTNAGSFLPGTVEAVIEHDAPPEIYRNPFLAEAMVSLNMIDTQGGGIRKMFQTQRMRHFPLPDYDLSDPNRVAVKIRGEILDERYTRLLMERTDLDLWTVILLDKVQKRVRISRDEHRTLKKFGMVEGRYPNLFVSSVIAAATGDKARHIRNKGLDKQYYRDMIVELVKKHSPVAREDIDQLLMDKLPDVLSEKQKRARINNLLAELSRSRIICNRGSRKYSQWVLGERTVRSNEGQK